MKVVTDSRHYDEIAKQIKEYGKLGDDVTFTPEEMHGQIGVEYVYYTGVNDGTEKGIQEGYASGFSQGEEQGRQEQNEEFWMLMLNSGNRASYLRSFGGARWTDSTFTPPEDLKMVASNMQACFHSSQIENINIDIDITGVTTAAYMNGAFYSGKFKKIKRLIVSEETTFYDTAFYGCTALEEIRFEGTIGTLDFDVHWSTKLSKSSLLSILQACNKENAGLTIALPAKCIDGKTVTKTYIANDTELSTALTNANNNGYTIVYS